MKVYAIGLPSDLAERLCDVTRAEVVNVQSVPELVNVLPTTGRYDVILADMDGRADYRSTVVLLKGSPAVRGVAVITPHVYYSGADLVLDPNIPADELVRQLAEFLGLCTPSYEVYNRAWLYGDLRPYLGAITVREVIEALLPHRDIKDALYRQSWARRGLVGWWLGAIGRSTDRIDGIMENVVRAIEDGDAETLHRQVLWLMDTLMDVGMYAFMGLQALASLRPDLWAEFRENLCAKTTGK